jgi:hypothetical protein
MGNGLIFCERKCSSCGHVIEIVIPPHLNPEVVIDVELTVKYKLLAGGWTKGWFGRWDCPFCNGNIAIFREPLI